MEPPKPTTAFIGTLYVGTDRLERPLTEPEKKELSARLAEHDFVGASLVSLRFAFKLRRSVPAAQDLQGRANLRFVRPAPVVPSATDLATAAELRRKAAAACDAKQWSVCLAKLDDARAVDPGGDDALAVKTLRDKAIAGRQEQR